MPHFVLAHKYITGVVVIALIGVSYFTWQNINQDPLAGLITATVERGDVRQLITVSGFVESKNTAELGFAGGGTISSITAKEGTPVVEGQVLATLDDAAIRAEKAQAEASKAAAESTRAELVAGPSSENRSISIKNVSIAQSELERIKTIENERVENALRTLRSAGLFATSDKINETAAAPVISGSYNCDKEGVYRVSIYNSGSVSGYSMNISGLESGTFPVSIEQDTPFGDCGLRAKFATDTTYSQSVWTIEIPNTKSPLYTANKNAYELTKTAAKNAIAAATQALSLAELKASSDNAAPRSEALARANSNINEAEARINQINARLANLTLTAPFSGVVTTVSAQKGETVTSAPIIKLVADGRFVLKARIPEIDITDILVGQKANIIFDAKDKETFTAKVSYVSPAATIISGVTYYETELALDNPPAWLRDGLNADVEIILSTKSDTLLIPKRFLISSEDSFFVRTITNGTLATSTITVDLLGNDGTAAISGLNLGDTIVAP